MGKTNFSRATKELNKLLNEHKYLNNLTPTEATQCSLIRATKKIDHPQIRIPPIKSAEEH